MALALVSNPDRADEPVARMRRRLDEFYATTRDYPAFLDSPDHALFYRAIEPYLLEAIQKRGVARVLELGAGRPSFPTYFQARRAQFEYHAQDVTPQNEAYLRQVADRVHLGDVSAVAGEFDLIFSTFVFEHVSTPVAFLDDVRRLLAVGGVHVVVSPRYDVPGYVCPSLRHQGRWGRWKSALFLAASRLRSRVDRRPRFWVNCDPAILHKPFYRDADAVHLVSRFDVEQWHRRNGFTVRRLRLPASNLRDYLLRRHLTLALACRKIRA